MQEYFDAVAKAFDFASMDTYMIITQLIGVAAMLLMIFSYQGKRTTILILQVVSSCLWVTHFILLGTPNPALLNGLAIPRGLLYAQRGRYKWADSPWLPVGCMAAFVIAGCFTYTRPIDLLPVVAMVISSYVLFIDRVNTIRVLSIIVSVLWGLSDAWSGSPPGVLCEVFAIGSIIVALVRSSVHTAAASGGEGATGGRF